MIGSHKFFIKPTLAWAMTVSISLKVSKNNVFKDFPYSLNALFLTIDLKASRKIYYRSLIPLAWENRNFSKALIKAALLFSASGSAALDSKFPVSFNPDIYWIVTLELVGKICSNLVLLSNLGRIFYFSLIS